MENTNDSLALIVTVLQLTDENQKLKAKLDYAMKMIANIRAIAPNNNDVQIYCLQAQIEIEG